jgi:hypothetical protein
MPSSYSNFKKTSRKLVVKSGETGIMLASDSELAPQVLSHPGARPTRRSLMDTTESSAPHAHPSTEDYDDTIEAHYACLERPCACLEGWVFVGYTDEDGEEKEASYPCRRCAASIG